MAEKNGNTADAGNTSYSCDMCQKSFASKQNLNNHKRIHSGEAFNCDKCNRSFTTKGNLDRHRLVHTGEKNFSCDICNKSFTTKGNLQRHSDTCKKSFTSKRSIKIHKRIRNEERFNRVITEKSFTSKHIKKIAKTILNREVISCDICNKSYKSKASLKRHNVVHTGEKNFTCDTCNKSFALKEYRDRHSVIHTGEKKFSCEICNKAFATKQNCDKHYKVHKMDNKPVFTTEEVETKSKEGSNAEDQNAHMDAGENVATPAVEMLDDAAGEIIESEAEVVENIKAEEVPFENEDEPIVDNSYEWIEPVAEDHIKVMGPVQNQYEKGEGNMELVATNITLYQLIDLLKNDNQISN